jgi:hypothetical protein
MCLIQTDSTSHSVTLALVVGDQPLTGYSAGFDLPLDIAKVRLADFTPGAALPPGSAPSAALGKLVTTGPLAGNLVVAQSQKASGTGAVATDASLPAHAVVLSFTLEVSTATNGVVFDGTAAGFHLPSGGLRNRAGLTVVTPDQVAIGKLEVSR